MPTPQLANVHWIYFNRTLSCGVKDPLAGSPAIACRKLKGEFMASGSL